MHHGRLLFRWSSGCFERVSALIELGQSESCHTVKGLAAEVKRGLTLDVDGGFGGWGSRRNRTVDQCKICLNRTLLNRSNGLMLWSTFDCRIAPCHEE